MKFLLKLLIIFLLLSYNTFAKECSEQGYTVLTLNGVFTDYDQASENKRQLAILFNDKNIKFDFLHNQSHLAGLGDIAKSIYQGIFDDETVQDYDLIEMIRDASEKVTTQKMLIVAHSQGNFYANSFYDVVTNVGGGVSPNSIGVYSVATPSGHVAGGGKWITSDTDKIISSLVGRVLSRKIMTPNTHIELSANDDSNGHSFSDVYLKYKSSQILSDINDSLSKLSTDQNKDTALPCINTPDITTLHKISGLAFAISDPIANLTKNTISEAYSATEKLAQLIKNLGVKNTATAEIAFEKDAGIIKDTPIQTQKPKTKTTDTSTKAVDQKPSQSKQETKLLNTIQPNMFVGGRGNNNSETNTINLEPTPDVPTLIPNVANITFPQIQEFVGDGINPNIGINDRTDFNFQIVYTDPANKPPQEIILHIKDQADFAMQTSEESDGDFTNGEIYKYDDMFTTGSYQYYFSMKDADGNISRIPEQNLEFKVNPPTYIYDPKYSFGTENDDGNDWQIWAFDGSTVYDWSNEYNNGFLIESFKIHSQTSSTCFDCLQRGIFNHDPKKGFEISDLVLSSLENNPQNNQDDIVYDISIQWDTTGYTYIISHGDVVDNTGHVDIENVGANTWVGWDTSSNDFQTFPSGTRRDDGFTGENMILVPQRVYKPTFI